MSNAAVSPQCENWTEARLHWLRPPPALSVSFHEKACQHLARQRHAANVSTPLAVKCSQGKLYPHQRNSEKPPTWRQWAVSQSQQHWSAPTIWLCLSRHPSCGGHTEAALMWGGCQGWLFRALAALGAASPSCAPSHCLWQRGLWELLLGLLSWAGFPSSHREGTVVSHACLYPRGLACGFVHFSLCLTFMRNHWEWPRMPGVSKGYGERASWPNALQ